MIVGSFFKPVKSITTQEVQRIIKEKNTEDYCLLDVRQPAEYAEKHIPGAKLIPLGDLQAHLKEVSPDKPTIVYCRSGNRSRSAVGMLNGAGFEDVYNMEGGMLAYNGIVAAGPPEAGAFCFPPKMQPEELVAMAWYIEDGSRQFIEKMKDMVQDRKARELFSLLSEHKSAHQNDLQKLFMKISAIEPDGNFPSSVLPGPPEEVMAGCVNVQDAVNWSRGKQLTDILDLMMALEANTLDLYLKLGRQVTSDEARKVFIALSDEEKSHLDALAEVFETYL